MGNKEISRFDINIRPCGAVDIYEELKGGKTYETVDKALKSLKLRKVVTSGLHAGFYSASFCLGNMGAHDSSNGVKSKNLRQIVRGAVGLFVAGQALRVGEYFGNIESSSSKKIEAIKEEQVNRTLVID